MTWIREEVWVAAPPRAVWNAVHEDLDNVPHWAGYLRRAEALDSQSGTGGRVRYELNLPGGFEAELVLRYTTSDPPRPAAGRFDSGPLSGTWPYTYIARDGGTALVYEMDYELRGLLRFAGVMLKGQYEEGIRQGMAMLKDYVESSS
jgi:polyketide cyclase/dehydrase/lipid transport protein